MKKINNRRGFSRIHAVLTALILALCVVIAVPWYFSWRQRGDMYACELSMKTAQEMLDVLYLTEPNTKEEDAWTYVIQKAELCPTGGDFFLARGSDPKRPYLAVCGLHDKDTHRRTRLCARRVLEQLQAALQSVRVLEREVPESITVTLNSTPLTARRVSEKPEIRHGTFSTPGYDGVVAFYGVEEDGFPAVSPDIGGQAGGVCWFCYADEDYCAIWSEGAWSGDSYE